MKMPAMTISVDIADEIYHAIQRSYRREDVIQKLSEKFPDSDFDKAQIDSVLSLFERTLDHSDGFYEEYWLCLEEAIRESGIKPQKI